MRGALLAALACVGCFNPSPPGGRPCGPDDWCPAPLSCSFGICGGGTAADDAPVDTGPVNVAFLSDPIVVAGKSLADLDAHCATGMPSGRYVAWYSSAEASAASRLEGKHGWRRPDGAPFANKLSDLLAGTIYTPLRLDRNGSFIVGEVLVATATRPDGGWTGNSCLGTSTGPLDVGVADATTGNWTDYEYGQPPCSTSVRLYCMQIDHSNDIARPAPPTSGPIVFVSSGTAPGTQGLGGLDDRCRSEASTTTAYAIVATIDSSARDKLPNGALTRPDGIVAFDEAHNQLAPINVTFDGKQYRNVDVWTGALRIDALGVAESCDDWTGAGGGLGRTGFAARSLAEAFGSPKLTGCFAQLPVYCVVPAPPP